MKIKTISSFLVLFTIAYVISTTVPVFGFGYEGVYNITLKPGETVDREVTLRLERNSDITVSVIGEGKEWITTPSSITDIAEGTKKVKHPFTITIPEDIELAGDYKTYLVATQKGETGGIIVINEEELIGMTITIEDPSLPKKIGKMSLTEIYAEEKIIRDAAKAIEDAKKANAPKDVDDTMVEEPAGPATHTVDIPKGTGIAGCEESNACYLPADITINAGDTVEWINVDTAAHTVSGGSSADGLSGVFDSSLVMANANYEFTFDDAGSYDYFCLVHPWMAGVVHVTGSDTMTVPTKSSNKLTIETQYSSYLIGDTVKISGKGIRNGEDVSIIVSKDNRITDTNQFQTIGGSYSGSIHLNPEFFNTFGTYTIKAVSGDISTSTTFILRMNPVTTEPTTAIDTIPYLERVVASNLKTSDAFGNNLEDITVNQHVIVSADLINSQDVSQEFVYIIKVQDSDDVTIHFGWLVGSLTPGQSLSPGQSWLPASAGTYKITTFVWESISNPTPLSPKIEQTIIVN